ncbi:hypothetical protein FCV25MIE_15681, partial [Fagus crenata]
YLICNNQNFVTLYVFLNSLRLNLYQFQVSNDLLFHREGRLLEENQEAQANHTLLSPEHFGTFFKVLIDCGPFIYRLY